MSKLKFRMLKPHEVECRVMTIKPNGFALLLYKDARCDMAILDEVVGAMNWQRKHSRENANCVVEIYDGDKQAWVSKEDTGTESNTERAKGLASDSFKRACFNWGIGRELYTAPFIWISEKSYIKNGKVYEKFKVYHMVVKNGSIVELGIQDSKGNPVYRWIDADWKRAKKEMEAKK